MEEGKALPISKYFNIAISLPCRVLAISPCKEGMGQEAQSGILACFPCRGDTVVPHLQKSIPSLVWSYLDRVLRSSGGQDESPTTATT